MSWQDEATFPSLFWPSLLFPCSHLAAGDRAEAILWCVLHYTTDTSKENQCFKNKSNEKNKRPMSWGQSHWLLSFHCPWHADSIAEDVLDLFRKPWLLGEDLRACREAAQSLSIWPFPCCICQRLMNEVIRSSVPVVEYLKMVGNPLIKCFFFSIKDQTFYKTELVSTIINCIFNNVWLKSSLLWMKTYCYFQLKKYKCFHVEENLKKKKCIEPKLNIFR